MTGVIPPYYIIVANNQIDAAKYATEQRLKHPGRIYAPVSPNSDHAIRGMTLHYDRGDRIVYLPGWWRSVAEYNSMRTALRMITYQNDLASGYQIDDYTLVMGEEVVDADEIEEWLKGETDAGDSRDSDLPGSG